MKKHKVVLTWGPKDKVWFASFPGLPGCLTQGKTIKEALEMATLIEPECIQVALSNGCSKASIEAAE